MLLRRVGARADDWGSGGATPLAVESGNTNGVYSEEGFGTNVLAAGAIGADCDGSVAVAATVAAVDGAAVESTGVGASGALSGIGAVVEL